jgi:trehalose 6-phosphate synthase
MADRPVVIVSNRGPLSFKIGHDGGLVAARGAGGLVSGIGPLVVGTATTWIAAALSPGDREAAASGVMEAEGFRVHTLALDPGDFRAAYDVVCNATLWFAYHGLFDLSRRPVFDRAWPEAWAAYRRVNTAFADAVAADAPDGSAVLVQDYHLALLGGLLAERRPDLRTVLFSHTPFPSPEGLRVLPPEVRTELLGGMAAHHACGFHTHRWADAFAACCQADLDTAPSTFVSPLGPDPGDIAAVAGSAACARELADIDQHLSGRKLVARVDRIELSKNLLRGFAAYDDLLTHHPEWRERVVFGAFVYPSREGLEEYHGYRRQVESMVSDINRRWATSDWEPVLLDPSDHIGEPHPRRAQPGGQGGTPRQRAQRCAAAQPGGGGVGGAGRRRHRRPPLRRGWHGRGAAPGPVDGRRGAGRPRPSSSGRGRRPYPGRLVGRPAHRRRLK